MLMATSLKFQRIYLVSCVFVVVLMASMFVFTSETAWATQVENPIAVPTAFDEDVSAEGSDTSGVNSEQDEAGDSDSKTQSDEIPEIDELSNEQNGVLSDEETPVVAANEAAIVVQDVEGADDESGKETEDVSDELQDTGVTMHRMYNPNSGEHFYTSSDYERDFLVQAGWNYEGVGWIAPSTGIEVYRLYNPNAGDHHYTKSEYERDYLKNVGWNYEGVGWYSGGDCAVLRQYNPNARTGAHNFTVSKAENDYLDSIGWNAEGVGWYALADSLDTLISRYSVASATVSAEGKDLQIEASFIDDMYYLFLPSFTDLHALRLSALLAGEELTISVADWGSSSFRDVALGGSVDVASLSTALADNGAHLMLYKASGSSVVQKLAVMVSSAISSVHIDSVDSKKDRAYVEASADHSAKANVCVTVVNSEGQLVYDKDSSSKSSSIKGRGNSTWGIGNKKPYQISLNKKADLLETGVKDNTQKKWLLLANANDATMLHNSVTYNLGLELGLDGTECTPVDLYYDNEYRGSYLLCEKAEVKAGRVDIVDLEGAIEDANPDVDFDSLPVKTAVNKYGKTFQYVEGVVNPEDITGGYLLEVDQAWYSGETCWFDSSWGHIVVKSPEYCSKEAMTYISEQFELALRRLNSGSQEAGDEAIIDIDSLAKTYLISEFAKNIDAFLSSTFIYKDADSSAFVVAPLWDFDGSMGVRTDWTDTSFLTYQGFVLPHATNATDFRPVPVAKIQAVQQRVQELWRDVLSPLLKSVLLSDDVNAAGDQGYLRSLAFYRQQIAGSQAMNEVLFGLSSFRNEIDPFATYELNVNYLENWLKWRTAWLDDNMWRLHDGVIENAPWNYSDVDYGLVFDAGYYVELNADTIGNLSDLDALRNFCEHGMAQGLVASRNFNVNVYKERYADLRAAFGNDLKRYYLHYIEYGFKEGRIAV